MTLCLTHADTCRHSQEKPTHHEVLPPLRSVLHRKQYPRCISLLSQQVDFTISRNKGGEQDSTNILCRCHSTTTTTAVQKYRWEEHYEQTTIHTHRSIHSSIPLAPVLHWPSHCISCSGRRRWYGTDGVASGVRAYFVRYWCFGGSGCVDCQPWKRYGWRYVVVYMHCNKSLLLKTFVASNDTIRYSPYGCFSTEASLGLQSGARAKKERERSRSSYFKK